jgi:hypothetical protein
VNNDAYLTEYYQDGAGDQFYPGCPASMIWFQRNPEGNPFFFPQKDTLKLKEENNNLATKTSEDG